MNYEALPADLKKLGERFWSKVEFTGSCWLWTAHLGTDGYGQYKINGRIVEPHRYVFEARSGRGLPAGLFAMHTCRNRNCCNPAHLRLGTNRENSLERSKDAALMKHRARRR